LGIGYFIGYEGVDIETKTVEINGKKIPKKIGIITGSGSMRSTNHLKQARTWEKVLQ
jgi:hypothetical protein